MATYSIHETETIIGITYDEKMWDVYTSIPRHVNKFRKLAAKYGAEVTEIHEGGIRVKLPMKAISFRAPSTRVVSEEQKAAAAERFRAMWEKRRAQGEVVGDVPEYTGDDEEEDDDDQT